MPTIPQRQLRNDVADVLRRAERGEVFTITVNGRPVAELGPLKGARRPASAQSLRQIFKDAPVDPEWLDELLRQRAADDAETRDPWA